MSDWKFKVIFCPQVSDIWWAVHRGVIGASDLDKVLTPVGKKCAEQEGHAGDHRIAEEGERPKSKGRCQVMVPYMSEQVDGVIDQLIADLYCPSPNYFTERGVPVNTYAIQNGKDMEPEARQWLSFRAGLDVTEVGCCFNEDFTLACSPDGLVGLEWEPDAGGEWQGQPWYWAKAKASVELKVPLLKTHLRYLLDGGLPQEYRPQCAGHLIVCGVEYVEFVSYSNVKPPLRVQVYPDDYTKHMRNALNEFHGRYNTALTKLKNL
jgi:hypothetical protein